MFLAQAIAHYFVPRHSNNNKARIIHSPLLAAIAGLAILFQVTISHPRVGGLVLGYASNIKVEDVITSTNQKRLQNGVGEVKVDADLTAAAQAKAADMFSKNYWAHVSPTGTQPWFFITQAKYSYLVAGENLARDFNDSGAVVEAWMNSPTHKENLLNPAYKDIGIAVVNGKLGGVSTTLVVQMFGTRLSSPQRANRVQGVVGEVEAIENRPTIALPVKIEKITPIAPSSISPFNLTKGLSSFILFILVAVFIVDILVIWRRKIVRISSDSAAHIAFLAAVSLAIWLIKVGVIL